MSASLNFRRVSIRQVFGFIDVDVSVHWLLVKIDERMKWDGEWNWRTFQSLWKRRKLIEKHFQPNTIWSPENDFLKPCELLMCRRNRWNVKLGWHCEWNHSSSTNGVNVDSSYLEDELNCVTDEPSQFVSDVLTPTIINKSIAFLWMIALLVGRKNHQIYFLVVTNHGRLFLVKNILREEMTNVTTNKRFKHVRNGYTFVLTSENAIHNKNV